jgi:peroxidase
MALPRAGRFCLLLAVAACLAYAFGRVRRADAAVKELRVGYYAETCPGAEEVVREAMARALAREARSVASVMRLQFHDCFVNVSTHAIDRSIDRCVSPRAGSAC